LLNNYKVNLLILSFHFSIFHKEITQLSFFRIPKPVIAYNKLIFSLVFFQIKKNSFIITEHIFSIPYMIKALLQSIILLRI